jgi:hypothetical protein
MRQPIANEVPQPQDEVAFGFETVNIELSRPL